MCLLAVLCHLSLCILVFHLLPLRINCHLIYEGLALLSSAESKKTDSRHLFCFSFMKSRKLLGEI